jgi:hypothetical protein
VNRGSTHPDREGFPAGFDRIEAAVDAGATDLRTLGFWRLLSEVKTDPALAAHWADQAGRIDRKAFERRTRIRFPVWLGNLVLVLGIVAGAIAIGVALTADRQDVAGPALVFAALAWSVAFHSPTHWLVGRAVGMRFIAYCFPTVFPPVPGLKIDYATYLRVSPTARAWMHASGAIASKVAPLAALAFWPATVAPTWAGWVLVGYGTLLIVIDVLFSTRRSDWKRVRRELRVARRQALAR